MPAFSSRCEAQGAACLQQNLWTHRGNKGEVFSLSLGGKREQISLFMADLIRQQVITEQLKRHTGGGAQRSFKETWKL